nr:MAG TPA: helix-turn-helix domain protein [Caudoviricetes sp.]
MARTKRGTFDEDMRKIVALNLGRALQQKGWTKSMLSEKTGISASTLSGYFTAKYNINEENLKKLSEILGVAPSDIDPRADASRYPITRSYEGPFPNLILGAGAGALSSGVLNSSALGAAAGAVAAMGAPITATVAAGAAIGTGIYAAWKAHRTEQNKKELDKAIEFLTDKLSTPEEIIKARKVAAEAEYMTKVIPAYLEACDKIFYLEKEIGGVSEDLALWIQVLKDSVEMAKDLNEEYKSALTTLKDE